MKSLFQLVHPPRSGSTVLTAILNQNPSLFVPFQSPLTEVLHRVASIWAEATWEVEVSQGYIDQTQFLNSVLDAYLDQVTDKPIVIDKHWSWCLGGNLDLMESLGRTPKLVLLARDIQSVLASLAAKAQDDLVMARMDQKVKTIFEGMNAVANGPFAGNVLVVNFYDLMSRPRSEIDRIYEFLGIPPFDHDFNHIEYSMKSIDDLIEVSGLHEIGPEIRPSTTNPREFFSLGTLRELDRRNLPVNKGTFR